jgi:HEAT repeat protein
MLRMMRRLSAPIAVFLLVISTRASGQSPVPPQADFDATTLRHAGIDTDAASLLNHLRYSLRNEGDATAIKALIERLADARFEKREEAVRGLIAVGRPALEALRQAHKKHEDPEVRLRAQHCIEVIESRLDANLTMAAVRRLIYLRAGGAAEHFLELLPVVDWEIQDEIVHGLPQVARRDGKLDSALLAALDDKLPLRRAAAALAVVLRGNDKERAAVRKLLTDSDAEVRLRAAQGLLAVHDASSLPVLIALLNEPAVEVSWSAEELLHWVAGEKAPTAKVGAASVGERTTAMEAWTGWHTSAAPKIDWDELEQAPRRPGLYLACDRHAVWLGGCVGGPRWKIAHSFAHDAFLLHDNHILVVQYGSSEVIKYDLTGVELWHRSPPKGREYVMCQHLPNGHFLLAGSLNILEMTPDGEEVSSVALGLGRHLADAWQPRTGPLFCRTTEGLAIIDRATGRVMDTSEINAEIVYPGHNFAVLGDGRCAVADQGHDRLVEVNARGETLHVLPVHRPSGVEPLRNGNYLVCAQLSNEWRILELDQAGHTLWESYTQRDVLRVRSVLDKVRIGFDKPQQPDYNLDSTASRVCRLRDPNPEERVRSLWILLYHPPTDANAIDGLTLAMDDKVEEVRDLAGRVLAEIGEPSVEALMRILQKGTSQNRPVALSALANMGAAGKAAVPALASLVQDSKLPLEERCAAINALRCIGPEAKTAIPTLLGALKSKHDKLRDCTPDSLVAIGPNDPTVICALIGAIDDDKYPMTRRAAIDALARLGPSAKAALPTLITILKAKDDPGGTLRSSGVEALGRMGTEAKPAIPAMVDLLKDPNQSVDLHRVIIRSLYFLGETGKQASPVLGDMLRDPTTPGVLLDILPHALSALGHDGVLELARSVNEGDTDGRRTAIKHLGRLGKGGAPAIPALTKASNDPDDIIRDLACDAIVAIRSAVAADLPPVN